MCGEDCCKLGLLALVQSDCVGVVGFQLFKAAGNTETVFSNLILLPL